MENLICTQFFDNLKSKRDTLDYINGKEHEKSRSLGRLWDKEQEKGKKRGKNNEATKPLEKIKTESKQSREYFAPI